MKRRDFSACLAAAGLGSVAAVVPQLAHAQGQPLSDSDYVKLGNPLPTEKGKIEVVEFFWYGCQHCFAFEPELDAWQKKLPADVNFKRVPAAFREHQVMHQRIYYALEALGLVESLHRKVFQAIHLQNQRLETEPDVLAFVTKNGVDAAKFKDALNSFAVTTKSKQASRLADGYKIDGVPTLGIHGRYFTGPGLVRSRPRALEVANLLIDKVRKGAR